MATPTLKYNSVHESLIKAFVTHSGVNRTFLVLSSLLMQLRKQFPSMNLKIPAKRIFGDNFEPGKSSQ